MSSRLSDAASELRESLHHALTDTFAAPGWGEPQAMSRALKEVRKSFDSAAPAASQQSIATSVWAFRTTGKLASFRDLKYACYGLGLRQGKDDSTLLGEPHRFQALIDEVHGLSRDARRFRKCYQGLLSSYLNFPVDESATELERTHWEQLRAYLRKQLAVILSVEPVASWVKVLDAHQNLLKNQPCKRYADELRKGKWDELEELAEGLAISSQSWVWKEAVLAHVQAVADIRADSVFQAELDLALHVLEGERVPLGEELRKSGTASLLRRYAKCQHRPQHEALLDLALRCFGKPWLHTTAWDAYVGDEEAQRLIDSWIKTGLIQDFFQLLAADGVADKSRMEFWPKFVPVISDIWFAMGSFAHDNRAPNYVKLRQRIGRERILKFSGAGYTNNAFIMRIGPFFVIEFGQKGRAAYVVHAGSWKGSLAAGASLSLEAWRLQNMGGKQMTHMPSDSWGDKFCYEICPKIGWWPGQAAPALPRAQRASDPPAANPKTPPPKTDRPKPPAPNTGIGDADPMMSALKAQLRPFNVEVEDLRRSGGCIWVRKGGSDPDLNRILIGRGFTFAKGKGWWKK